jgi:hypothetical protein
MIINLLVQFPDIFTISFNLASSTCSLSYMVRNELDKEDYITFCRQVEENIEAYHFLQKKEHRKVAVRKKTLRGFTKIEIDLCGIYINDEISLITHYIRDRYGETLISEIRPEELELSEESYEPWQEILEYFMNRTRGNNAKNLFAFRDAGKVYVFDK